ncbi:LysR family transcriptional regulator [Paenibacillus silvae]|uniref:LysR family transcriptional regulator n=1 Tax=Paenibacillus silvae TaxID=1325358 RepID=UPI0011A59A34|nr:MULTISPECIES: LysR family transcriptional regulator [Paenibacillus]MCK6073753.1 LysR family transcriptional regulator [Paenibacillus silvae]MCK6148770.1 LysR family transcriptional regulator [Paenibacillus silvae]MCK6267071.1 LysR family transcriptional regulator [Paenibacillus silvae]
MNLHGLRLFHAIVRYGGVTRAAEELNISQPAVSSQVKRFEREIGIQLFVSEGRKLVLTDAGTQLITYAERLFMLEQEVEHFVEDMIQGRKGLIRLSATYLPSNFLLPSWIARFKQAHEDVEIIVSTSNTQMAFDQLLRYEAEIAIYGGSGVSHPGVHWDKLFEDEMWFVVHPDHAYAGQTIPLHQMVAEPFIMREQGSATRERLAALCTNNNLPSPRIALQFDGLNETISAVKAGYGANFISSLVVREDVQQGRLARVFVDDVQLQNTIAICTRAGEKLSPAASQLVQWIRQESRVMQQE